MSNNHYINRRARDRAPTEEELKFFVEVTEGRIEKGDWLGGKSQWADGAVGTSVDWNHDVYKPVMRYMPPPEV